jgi:hypothetical protein
VYTSCVLRGALRLFNEIFLLITKKKKKKEKEKKVMLLFVSVLEMP